MYIFTHTLSTFLLSLVVWIDNRSLAVENLYHKLMLLLRGESQHSNFFPAKAILKKPLQWSMCWPKGTLFSFILMITHHMTLFDT